MQKIKIHEVGLRDGLQIEQQIVPLEQKIKWVEALLKTGLDMIQLGSFVNPAKVPQMADTDSLFAHVAQNARRHNHVALSALVLNEKGLDRGMAAGVEMFCMGVSASDTHSRRNTGMGTEEALTQTTSMARKAMAAGKLIQASVQSAFGCGFEGEVPPERVLEIVEKYLESGIRCISLADTAGHATPPAVESLFSAILKLDPQVELACHFHNTYGLGLANCCAALRAGVISFESAFGGLGGCPFTKVAAGNVCTEDLVHSFQRMGIRTDIDLERLIEIAREVSCFFNRELPGLILKSGSLMSVSKTDRERAGHEVTR